MRSLSLIVTALVALPAAAPAQGVPSTLAHMGRLLSPNDEPAAGQHTLTFKLYDDDTGGTAKWTGTFPVNVDVHGLYSVNIGDENNPLPASLSAGDARYLGISVDGEAEMVPRLELGSVIYAFRAGEAASMKNGTINGATITGTTTIAGATLTNPIITGGTLDVTSLDADTITLNGTAVGTNSVSKSGDVMSGALTAPSFNASTTSGPPFTVASAQKVANLNADLLDGKSEADFWLKSEFDPDSYVLKSTFDPADYATLDDLTNHDFSNRVRNGGVEIWSAGASSAPDAWQTWGGTAPSVSTQAGWEGTSALRISDGSNSARTGLKQVVYASGSASITSHQFTFAVWYKRIIQGIPAVGQICISDAGADQAETSQTCTDLGTSGNWTRATVSHTTSANPEYLRVSLSPTKIPAESMDYDFDGAILVPGGVAPPFARHVTEQLYGGHNSGIDADKLDGLHASELQSQVVPTGTVWMFDLSACPSGWTELTEARGRALVGLPASGTLKGTVGSSMTNLKAIGHTHDYSTVISHTHGVIDPGHRHQLYTRNDDFNCSGDGSGYFGVSKCADNGWYGWNIDNAAQAATTTTGITISSTGSSTGTATSADTMPYVQLLVCRKN